MVFNTFSNIYWLFFLYEVTVQILCLFKKNQCFGTIINAVLAVIKNLRTDPHLYSHLISDPDVKAIQWENKNLFNKLI